ncbi:hypothetical protein OZX74_00425 [Bifidobacterium sp. ESL0798]|uniref:leucine-rich repeat domain-containing protein n=1 Tax=Bifidobacterium sp. ESL0798 TaxID=2983235 RepID=UPI0023F845B1|nr:leucine-rich repeat domain-containing protein [Bifidobacterium sp. ESL0798]WEV74078.1 hypothetical protein OZX74_00425 [Bifidobacterium sp. ESL0798]
MPESSTTQSEQPQTAANNGTAQAPQAENPSAPAAPTSGENKPATPAPAPNSPAASASKEGASPTSGNAAKSGTASKGTAGKTQPESKSTQPQTPSAQSTPQPAAQGGDEATVDCGTLKGCFPDASFRAYLTKFINTTQYQNPNHETGWRFSNPNFADDFPVTQSWLDSITSISSDGIPNAGSTTLSRKIMDIRGIGLFRNLKSFNMYYDNSTDHQQASSVAGFAYLTDFSPLTSANMPNLETLRLNDFTDAVAQSCKGFTEAKAPKLTNIYLYDVAHAFSDASMFYGLPHLKTLSLGNTDLGRNGTSDVQAIVDHFPDLESLSFENAYNLKSHPDSLLALKNLQHLKSFGFTGLFLYQNPVLKDISQLHQISDLDLSSNSIYNLDFLSGMTNLKTLNLNDNEISDLRPLNSLTGLESVQAVHEIPRIGAAPIIGADGSASFSYGNNYNVDGTVPSLSSVSYLITGIGDQTIPADKYTNDAANHVLTVPSIDPNIQQLSYTLSNSIILNGRNVGTLEIINNQNYHNPQVTFDFRGGRTPNGNNTTTAPRSAPYGTKLAAMWHPCVQQRWVQGRDHQPVPGMGRLPH